MSSHVHQSATGESHELMKERKHTLIALLDLSVRHCAWKWVVWLRKLRILARLVFLVVCCWRTA